MKRDRVRRTVSGGIAHMQYVAASGCSGWARRVGVGTMVIGAGCVALGVMSPSAHATPARPEHKITLCHRTDSYTNPYVVITVDVASVQFEGHDGHDGPVFYPAIPKHQKWGDIIPPFNFGNGESYPGKNWTPDGIATFNHGCSTPPATTTTTTVALTTTTTATEPTTSTTTPSSTTSTTSDSTTTSTTTEHSTTSTTASPTNTSTTEPVTVTTAGGVTTTIAGATSTTTGATVSTLGAPTTTTAPPGGLLPRTGAGESGLIVAGLAMIASGLGLARKRRMRA